MKKFYTKVFSVVFILFFVITCTKDDPIIQYELITNASPIEGGNITPSAGTYEAGAIITVKANPSPEYIFKEWKGSVTGTSNPVSVTINSNKNISGVFEKRKYPLSIIVEGEGTVTEELIASKSSSDYPSGSLVRLTAVPSDGWEFVEWSGAVESIENPVQLNIDKEKTVTVKFEKGAELKYKESIIQLRNEVLNIIRLEGEPSWTYSFDFENDGDLDMILIRTNSDGSVKKEMILFKNEENSNFIRIHTGISCWGRTIVFDDFNNDGLMDFFVPDHGKDLPPFPGGQDQLIYQTSEGTLIDKTNELLPQISNFSHGGSSLDLENDGDIDLIVNTGGSQLVYRNNSGSFEVWEDGFNPILDGSVHNVGGHPIIDGEFRMDIWDYFISGWWSNSGDFNNDGFDDLIIGCGFNDLSDPPDFNNVRFRTVDPFNNVLEKSDLILLQDSESGQLIYNYPDSLIETSWRNTGSIGVTFGLLVNDFNQDNCLDFIAYSSNYKDSHRLQLNYGNCDGTFEVNNIFELPINSLSNDNGWENFNLIDIDNDDDLDVIVSNDIQWTNSFEVPEEHVVLENFNGTFEQRNGKISDLIFLPPHVAISWYLDGE